FARFKAFFFLGRQGGDLRLVVAWLSGPDKQRIKQARTLRQRGIISAFEFREGGGFRSKPQRLERSAFPRATLWHERTDSIENSILHPGLATRRSHVEQLVYGGCVAGLSNALGQRSNRRFAS